MAHKKAGGSSRNGRDSESKRLGVKIFGGQKVTAAASSCASAEPDSTTASMSAAVVITPSSRSTDGVVKFVARPEESQIRDGGR
jgi:hypothetical protein